MLEHGERREGDIDDTRSPSGPLYAFSILSLLANKDIKDIKDRLGSSVYRVEYRHYGNLSLKSLMS